MYLNHKYKNNWCLSPDQSLLAHAGNWTVPSQLIIKSPKGNNTPTPLPHYTSLFHLKSNLPDTQQQEIIKGIKMYNLAAAIIYCSAGLYTKNPIDVRTALSLIKDASQLLPTLLENGHTTIAGRLAGAFRNINRDKIANQIMAAMKQAGYDIREHDPFENQLDGNILLNPQSAAVNRIKLIWQQMRETIIADFLPAPGIAIDKNVYLNEVNEVYIMDAYHSLSIERYKVNAQLIERVSSGLWDKNANTEDGKHKDAMAARGYYQAFGVVKQSIVKVLNGENAGTTADINHGEWYRQLFDPSVATGILKVSDLAGYRNSQVYIGGSKHVPLSVDAMRDAMPTLFELLENEPEASVRAVLGHFIFVYIHPYMDGNGRMGRFLMNVMLASGGYPWTVIPVQKRTEYMDALEQASVKFDIAAFSKFMAYLVSEAVNGRPVAKLPEV
ncbi:MAG: cell filamentation protein Fic [Sphingobacteriales bacterium]|nr:MAG: cell filamentation protein Fic [Sphingobacteriales bacterium]